MEFSTKMHEKTDGTGMDPLLRIEGFSLRFQGHDVCVVDELNITVSAGETLCIVGESGCGKSVSAMALMGLLPKDVIEIPEARCGLKVNHLT